MKATLFAALVAISGSATAQDRPARIADEGTLGQTHQLAPGAVLPAPGYPGAYADAGDDVCIALGYTVKADGTTGDFRLLQAWSSARARAEKSDRYLDTFASAAADAVSQWRFQPREGVAAGTVDTVATLTFRGGKGATEGLAERCRITDLAAHYARLENGRIPLRRTIERARDNEIAASIRRSEAYANAVFSNRP